MENQNMVWTILPLGEELLLDVIGMHRNSASCKQTNK